MKVKTTDKDIRIYELPKELQGLIVFFLLFISYCVIAGEYGLRGPVETYMMFALVWSIFLFQIYKIELIDKKVLIFHRVTTNTKIEIQNIKTLAEGMRYYRLYHDGGTLYLDHMISNIESFKQIILDLNPEIKTENISLRNLHKDWWGMGFLLRFLILVGLFISLFCYIVYVVMRQLLNAF